MLLISDWTLSYQSHSWYPRRLEPPISRASTQESSRLSIINIEREKIAGQSRVVNRMLGIEPLAEQYVSSGFDDVEEGGAVLVEPLVKKRKLFVRLRVDVVGPILHHDPIVARRDRYAQVGAVDLFFDRHDGLATASFRIERIRFGSIHQQVVARDAVTAGVE